MPCPPDRILRPTQVSGAQFLSGAQLVRPQSLVQGVGAQAISLSPGESQLVRPQSLVQGVGAQAISLSPGESQLVRPQSLVQGVGAQAISLSPGKLATSATLGAAGYSQAAQWITGAFERARSDQ